jgi:hypothetical protein
MFNENYNTGTPVCGFKNFVFILMCSINLDHFQLMASSFMQIAYWLLERGRKKQKKSSYCDGEGKLREKGKLFVIYVTISWNRTVT